MKSRGKLRFKLAPSYPAGRAGGGEVSSDCCSVSAGDSLIGTEVIKSSLGSWKRIGEGTFVNGNGSLV